MHFSPFLAPLLLLAGQWTMISAILTPEEILAYFKEAVETVTLATSDASAITALNAASQYSLIVQDAVDAGNGFVNLDAYYVQGSANLNKTAEQEISVVAVGQYITSLLTYYTTLQNKAPDFLDPSQKLGIIASIGALTIGAESFLLSVAAITPNVTIKTTIQVQQINEMLRAYAFATAAYGIAE